MADKKYLLLRHQSWYLQLPIPKQLHDLYSKSKIVVALNTRDLREAQRKRDILVGQYRQQFHEREQLQGYTDFNGHFTAKEAILTKREIQAGLHGESKPELLEGMQLWVEQKAEASLKPRGRAAKGISIDAETGYRTDIDPKELAYYQLAHDAITSDDEIALISTALSEHLEEYTHITNQARLNRERRVKDFIDWVGDKRIDEVTKREAANYLSQRVQKFDLSTRTKKGYISDISTFFKWCYHRHYCSSNPFNGLSGTINSTTRGTREKTEENWKPFSDDDLIAIFKAIMHRSDTEKRKKQEVRRAFYLFPFSLIALYTGMRSNEIAETHLADVHSDHIYIPEGKSESACRDVPIHPMIAPIIDRLKTISTDGHLIPNIKRGGVDSKRNHNVSKRFSHLIRPYQRPALIPDRDKVFHSFRSNMATRLENLGVPESTAEQIIGHKKQSLTYGLYSHGVALPELIRLVHQVTYGEAVENLLGQHIEQYFSEIAAD